MVSHPAMLELADDTWQATVLFQHLQCDLQHRALALLRADAEHVFYQPVQQSHSTLCVNSTRSVILRDRGCRHRASWSRNARPLTQRRWKKSTDRRAEAR